MPFSKYNLTVYTKSVEGLYNSNMPLTLSAETKPDEKAGTPRDLKVIETVDGSKHQTSWLPPYPPTGEGKIENCIAGVCCGPCIPSKWEADI